MKKFTRKTCLIFIACFLLASTACFASDCAADKTYHHCLDTYVSSFQANPSSITASDFQNEISAIGGKIQELSGGKDDNPYVNAITIKLYELEKESNKPDAKLPIEQWKLEATPEVGGIPWKILETNNCDREKPITNKSCEKTYQSAALYATYIRQVGSAIDRFNHAEKQALYYEYANRMDKWNSYLYDTQFQYFWELAANRYLDEKIFKRIVRNDKNNEIGFRDPPQGKAIFIHPDVGLQYVRKQPQGQQVKPALIFQWLGYQWWDWVDNKVFNLRGISLVSTLSDNASGSRTGGGIQFQYDDYAVAFTKLSGGVAVTLNLKLVDHISTLNNDYVSKLKAPN